MLLHYKIINTTVCVERDFIMYDGEKEIGQCYVYVGSPTAVFRRISVSEGYDDFTTLRYFMQEMILRLPCEGEGAFIIEPTNTASSDLFSKAGYSIGTKYSIADTPALL